MYRRLLRNQNFIALWTGQAVSSIGDYFSMLAIPIFVNRLTGSVMMVGLSFLAAALPALILGPVAGVFVDRFDRRKVMIVSDVLRGLLTLCLLVIHDASQVWVLYLVGFLISCTSQFFMPARGAVLPNIVRDPQDWLAANGIMQITQTVGMLAGPALAGFAIGLWGERVAFIADGTSFFVSAAAIFFMRIPRAVPEAAPREAAPREAAPREAAPREAAPEKTETPQSSPAGGQPGLAGFGPALQAVWAELREGMDFLFSSRAAMGVLVCQALATLGFSTVNMIWIPYLQRAYGVGAEGLGLADAAMGLGMMLSGMLVGVIARRLTRTTISAGGFIIEGIMYMTIIFLPSFPWVLGWQFLGGLILTPLQSALTTIMQMAVPDAKRGRVGSTMSAASSATALLSMGFATLFGDAVGLRAVFVIVGAFVLGAGILGFWLLREPEDLAPGRAPVRTA